MSRVCVLVHDDLAREAAAAIGASLQQRGASATSDVHDARGCAAIVCVFHEASETTCRLVRNLVAEGHQRVLALACQPTSSRDAWLLLQHGACDVLSWRGADTTSADIVERLERWDRVDALLGSNLVRSNLVGQSVAWLAVLRQIVEIACFTHAPMLICGETGTGKELAARLVHGLDPRTTKGDLVLVDCTTLVPELAGSELFGHERGAFTGATASRDGACALADGGTLFLDEIGELPPRLQAELLRVVQEGAYKRVGADTWRTAKFRLVCATNRDLRREIARGRFRADLFYRIAGASCTLPPLRDRRDDILPLVEFFVRQARPQITSAPCVDETVAEYLMTRDYPGNVRDLRQLVARMLARHPGNGPLTAGDIPFDERPAIDADGGADWRDDAFVGAIRRAIARGIRLPDIGRAAEEMAIRLALGECESTTNAARRLGVTNRALQLRRSGRRPRPVGRAEV